MQRTVALAAGLLAAGVAVAGAQHPGCPMCRPHAAMGCGMGMGHATHVRAFAPAALLEARELLGLSEEQVRRLSAVEEVTGATREAAMALHDSLMGEFQSQMALPMPELDVVKGLMTAAHAAMGRAHTATLEAVVESMALLDAEQRRTVAEKMPALGRGFGRRWVGCPAGRPGRGHRHRRW